MEKPVVTKTKTDVAHYSALNETVHRMAEYPNPVEGVNNMYGSHPASPALQESVQRIALHSNPVEGVNNMYGCHPDATPAGRGEYFAKVYGKPPKC